MSKKVMISLPDELLAQIDSVAGEEHRSRSELIREAARLYIAGRQPGGKRPIDNPRVREALETMDRIAKKIDTGWDSAQAVRDTRDRDKPPTDHDIT